MMLIVNKNHIYNPRVILMQNK